MLRNGLHKTENGVSVGYRLDSEREFFETKMKTDGMPEPDFPEVPNYAATVQHLFSAFNKIALPAMESVAAYMGIDPQFFLDLTDMESNGSLPLLMTKNKETGEVEEKQNLSSSLLRICKYGRGVEKTEEEEENDKEVENNMEAEQGKGKEVWFGAHTDSSFLTISLCSSTAGLDIVDQLDNKWICPELQLMQQQQQLPSGHDNSVAEGTQANNFQPQHHAVVFVGEFLQVLSKHKFKAAVHRVRNFGVTNYGRDSVDSDGHNNHSDAISISRVSCPYLIRGRHGAVIDLHNTTRYHHPGGSEALDEMPNLDGTSVKMMHKLLDLKRQKCFRDNGSAEGRSWVLSAYPTAELPCED